MGDKLIVALTLDEYVKKGPERPIQCWLERREMLRALRCVDAVYASTELTSAIMALTPNVIAKGADWRNRLPKKDIHAAKEVGAEIRFTMSEKRSTSELIERIRCSSA